MMRSWKARTLAFFLFVAALLTASPRQTSAQDRAAADSSLSTAAAAETPVAFAEKFHLTGVHKAGKVSGSLYRGAQPAKEGFIELKKLGITTVVNLRDSHDEVSIERKQVESLGMRYVTIPLNGWSAPTDSQVAEFLSLLQNSPGQAIFVHCQFGVDRTGVLIAAYRIAQQHWSAEQAIKEMYAFGFHYHWHPAMEAYVRKFPARFAGDSVFAPLRPAPSMNCASPGQPACGSL